MRDLRSFVVKVYRQQAGTVTGTIEEVRTGRTVPFRTMEELWQAVGVTTSRRARGSGRRADPAISRRSESSQSKAGSENDEPERD